MGRAEYNDAIEKLNGQTEKYVNIKFAYDGRCVGSIPTVKNGMFIDKNKLIDSESRIHESLGTIKVPETWSVSALQGGDTGCFLGDENSSTDWNALRGAGLSAAGESYWLASRKVEWDYNNGDCKCMVECRDRNGGGVYNGIFRIERYSNIYSYSGTAGLRVCVSLKSSVIKITSGDGKSAETAFTIGL